MTPLHPTSSIEEVQEEIVASFLALEGERMLLLDYLMDLGDALPKLTLEEQKPAYLVKGCLAKVWLIPSYQESRIYLRGASNTAITQGLLSLVIRLFSGRTPEQIIKAPPLYCFEKIGLSDLLGLRRRAGLNAMLHHVGQLALAWAKTATNPPESP